MSSMLVVEDEAIVRMVVVRLLERAGHRAVHAEQAADVLPLLENEEISLVVCDLNLPGANGTELLVAVRSAFPQLPVVVITGAADAWQLDAARRLGVERFIFKPFAHAEFLTTVAEALNVEVEA